MRRILLLAILLFLSMGKMAKAQIVDLPCPVGTRAIDILTTRNTVTGHILLNLCVDIFGTVTFQGQTIGTVLAVGPPGAIQFVGAASHQNGTANLIWSDGSAVMTMGGFEPEIVMNCSTPNGCGGIGSIISEINTQFKDLTGVALPASDISTLVDNANNGTAKAHIKISVLQNSALLEVLDIQPNTVGGADLRFQGSSNGSASIRVAAAAGSPNPLQLPIVTGAAGAVLSTDGGNPQQLSWITAPTTPIQAYSVTTESVDTALTASTLASVNSKAVTFPSSGCPCRVDVRWFQYATTSGASAVMDGFVNDGSNTFAEAEWTIPTNNGISGGGYGISPVTYANNASVTFTVKIQADATGVTARAAAFHAIGMRNSRLEVSVIASN